MRIFLFQPKLYHLDILEMSIKTEFLIRFSKGYPTIAVRNYVNFAEDFIS